jgi:UDP-N-acetylglucosamine 2-epimerase (non-hydrolysing)
LVEKDYLVLTLHRPANVDDEAKLEALLSEIVQGSRQRPIVFPVHPRTAKVLQKIQLRADHLYTTEPLGYREFNYLVKYARAVITDSGGITEEATVLGVPCLTLRDTTERPETVTLGTNELVGTDPAKLAPYLDRLFAGEWKKGGIPPLWDGQAAGRIVAHLERLLGNADS